MSLLDRYFRAMLANLRQDYLKLWSEIVAYGRHTPAHPVWGGLRSSVRYILGWSDVIAAGKMRRRATGEGLHIPETTQHDMEAFAERARAEAAEDDPFDTGRLDLHRRTLNQAVDATPWALDHREISNPFVIERAKMIAEVEREFVEERGKSLSLSPADPAHVPIHRVEMFYRHGLADVKNVAEQVQLADPEIGDLFPYAQYFTREDRRVRPTHAAMHGFVALRTWEGWPTVAPKNGWNCRCLLLYVARHQAIERGWMTPGGEPKFELRWPNSAARRNYERGAFPDKGWHGPKPWAPAGELAGASAKKG